MALDTLRDKGYTVETTQIATINLVANALVNGDLDIAYFSDQQAWAAVAQKAPIRTIMSFNGDPYLLAVRQDIKECSDMQRKTVAVGSVASVNTAMLDQYLKRNCPGTQPTTTVIPSSPSRYAALLSGQMDSALLETDDALQLESQAPGRFRVLSRFYQEFPTIEVGGYQIDANFGKQHPGIVKDFVTALIQAHRRIQDKPVLLAGVNKYLKNDPTAVAAVDTYLAQNAWDVNGGLTKQSVRASLDFLVAAKMLPAGLTVDQVADLSYLDAVLNELGRK
jgi:ABC-type nitrate/sulfonate/bicarbonate transport system substrate-binding protein